MTKAHRHRPERLATLIQESLAEALATQVKDPRVGFVTITGVHVTPDGAHARVRVSVMGTAEEKASAMEGVESARGFLRTHLARTLSLRTTPQLRFELDRGLEHAARIDEILHQLKRDHETPS